MTDPYGHLRVGNLERDQAIADLQRAAADGKLQPDELQERIEAAGRARTRADLAALLGDLKPVQPSVAAAGPTVRLQQVEAYPGVQQGMPAVPTAAPAGFHPDDPLILNAGFTGAARGGDWQIPPFLRAQALADNVRLDCLQAIASTDVIDLEVLPGAGNVVLILPEGWGVRYDRLKKSWGNIRVKVPASPEWGRPLIVARGSIGMGTFKARHANRFERRRLGEYR